MNATSYPGLPGNVTLADARLAHNNSVMVPYRFTVAVDGTIVGVLYLFHPTSGGFSRGWHAALWKARAAADAATGKAFAAAADVAPLVAVTTAEGGDEGVGGPAFRRALAELLVAHDMHTDGVLRCQHTYREVAADE